MITKGYIYKIICNLDNSFCYIGSTFSTLNKRFEEHKRVYKNKYGEISIHKYFDQYGIDNFKIELIKSYNVIRTHQKDHKHLCVYETLWINKTKNCVNKQAPFNPLRKEKVKQHYEKNKEEIAEYKNNIMKKIKNKLLEKNKKYRDNHKKEISEKAKQKFNCDCGGKYTLSGRAKHFKTIKHIKFLENKY